MAIELYRIDMDGTNDAVLVNTPFLDQAHILEARVSPDRARIALAADNGWGPGRDLYLVDADGVGNARVFFADAGDVYLDEGIAWSPDSATVYWCHDSEANKVGTHYFRIVRKAVDSGAAAGEYAAIVRPTAPIEIILRATSPDGSKLLYTGADGKLYTWQIDGGVESAIVSAHTVNSADWGRLTLPGPGLRVRIGEVTVLSRLSDWTSGASGTGAAVEDGDAFLLSAGTAYGVVSVEKTFALAGGVPVGAAIQMRDFQRSSTGHGEIRMRLYDGETFVAQYYRHLGSDSGYNAHEAGARDHYSLDTAASGTFEVAFDFLADLPPGATLAELAACDRIKVTVQADTWVGGASASFGMADIRVATRLNAGLLTVAECGPFTYTGAPHTPEPEVRDGGTVLVKDTDYSLSYADNTDAGAATLTVTGIGNYAGAQAKSFTIDPAPLTVTPDTGQGRVFGEPDPELTYAHNGAAAGETPAFTGALARVPGEDVGGYEIQRGTLALADNAPFLAANYSLEFTAGVVFTIGKADSAITATGATSYTYTGTPQGPDTAEVTGSTGAVTTSYSGTGGTAYGPSADKPTAAGTYQVVATVAADANHNGAESAPLAFTVSEAAATVTLSDLAHTYDATAKSATATTVPPGLTVIVTYDGGAVLPVAAGTYAVLAVIDDPNHAGQAAGELTIAPRAASVAADDQDKTYGEADPALTHTVQVPPVAGDAFAGALTRAPGEDAGVYAITQGTLTLGSNYDLTVTPGTLTIGKATPTITWPAPDPITQGTVLSAVQLNATANVAGTFTYNPGAGTILPVGQHLLTASFTPDNAANWRVAEAEASLTVIPIGNPPPDWTAPVGMPNSMEIYAKVKLRGASLIETEGSLLAAFKGSECRGVVEIGAGPTGPTFILQVFSHAATELDFTLQVWDAATGDLYSVAEGFDFVQDGRWGEITAPVLVNAGLLTHVIYLVRNWNWISFNVLPLVASPANVLGVGRWQDNDTIKGPGGIATFAAGQWWGASNVAAGMRYLLQAQGVDPEPLRVTGLAVPVSPLALVAGWNWLGYTPQNAMPVDAALASLTLADNDTLKTPAGLATYANGQWWGPLSNMTPGTGYLLKLANPGTLVYPETAKAGGISRAPGLPTGIKSTRGAPGWTDPVGYANSMAIYAKVEADGVPIEAPGSLLAAFKNGECRGVVEIGAGPTGPTFILQVFSNAANEPGLTLRVWDANTDDIHDLAEPFDFVQDDALGGITTPATFTVVVPPPPTGALQVEIMPPAAAQAGARWSIDDGATWRENGAILDDLPGGEAIVRFSELTGWHTPESRTVTIVVDETLVVSGTYVVKTYELAYASGLGGTLQGETTQIVPHGDDGTPVVALPDQGKRFVRWNDGRTDNPRTDTHVTAPVTVAAEFADKFVPTITWPAPEAVVYGTALSGTQLNTTADTPGVFVYDPPAGTVLPAGAHTLHTAFTPDDAVNWATTEATVELTVTRAPLTVRADDQTRPYGEPNPALTWTASGFVAGEDAWVLSGMPELACAATPASPVAGGPYPITIAQGTLAAANYAFAFVDGALTVTRAAQTITFAAPSAKTYGDAPFAVSATASSGLPVTLASSNPAVATVAAARGEWAVTVRGAGETTLTAAQPGDDNWNPAEAVAQPLTVARAALTVTADNKVRRVGQPNPAFTCTPAGLVGGDTLASIGVEVIYACAADEASEAGDYPVMPSGPETTANYAVTYAAGVLTVTTKGVPAVTWPAPAPIVYGTALDGTRLNAEADTPGTFAYDPPAGTVLPVGAHTLHTAFTPDDAVNWATTEATVELTVTRAPLTAIAEDQTRPYGEPNPALTWTASGFVAGEDAWVLSGMPELACAATPASPVAGGPYPITIAQGTLAAANYAFAFVDGALTVTRAAQTIAFAAPAAKTYGDASFAVSATASSGLPVTLSSSNEAVATVAAARGEWMVTVHGAGETTLTATQPGDGNWNPAEAVAQPLTVARAALTVTADNKVRRVGQPNPAFTCTPAGLVGGDTLAGIGVEVVYVCAADEASEAGDYPVMPSGPETTANYAVTYVAGMLTVIAKQVPTIAWPALAPIVYGTALSGTQLNATADTPGVFVYDPPAGTVLGAGTHTLHTAFTPDDAVNWATTEATVELTVTRAPLTAIAEDQTRAYGAPNLEFSIRYEGLQLADLAPAVPPTASCAANAASPVGPYVITLSGGSDPNYELTLADGTLTVVRSTLTVTALDAARLYGDQNPEFPVTITGFVDGDDASVLDELPTATCEATPASPVATYAIVPSGGAAANYAFAYVNGTLTVSPAPLACTASDQERLFWTPNPPFTITYTGLRNADLALAVPPVATCAAVRASDPGAYPIILTGGADPDYVLTLANGTLTVVPAVEVPPVGDFELAFVNPTNPAGRRLWDFTGHYEVAVQGYTLRMDLIHAPKGTLSGGGRLAGAMPSGVAIDVPLKLTGKVSGGGGAVSATVTLSGRRGTATVKLKLTFALADGQLAGAYAGTIYERAAGRDLVSGGLTLPLGPAMDGEVRLAVSLERDVKGAITGFGLLRLSNGREVFVRARGRQENGSITLQLFGDRAADPFASGVALKLSGRTLSNGTIEVLTLSGNAFGQALRWP